MPIPPCQWSLKEGWNINKIVDLMSLNNFFEKQNTLFLCLSTIRKRLGWLLMALIIVEPAGTSRWNFSQHTDKHDHLLMAADKASVKGKGGGTHKTLGNSGKSYLSVWGFCMKGSAVLTFKLCILWICAFEISRKKQFCSEDEFVIFGDVQA